MPKPPDQAPLPTESAPIAVLSGEVSGEAAAPARQAPLGGPGAATSVRDAEPDRPYTLRLSKAVMRDFENWVRVRGKRKKPVIEAALREYMARHSAD